MKLYEINEEMKELEEVLLNSVDEETGEFLADDELLARIEELKLDKEKIIEYLVKKAKETEFNLKAVDEAKKNIAEHQKRLKNQHARLVNVIARECDGEKRDYGFATVNFRKTKSVMIDDEISCMNSLFEGGYDDCIKTETSIRKAELGKLIKSGIEIGGCHIEENVSCSVK